MCFLTSLLDPFNLASGCLGGKLALRGRHSSYPLEGAHSNRSVTDIECWSANQNLIYVSFPQNCHHFHSPFLPGFFKWNRLRCNSSPFLSGVGKTLLRLLENPMPLSETFPLGSSTNFSKFAWISFMGLVNIFSLNSFYS